jgi:diguanylate cyclase (GGDEF)-like protein
MSDHWERAADLLASRPIAVIADLDWFMAFNDAYGFGRGDEVLAQFQSMLDSIGKGFATQTVRTGGDEFSTFFTNIEDGREFSARLAASLKQLCIPFEHEGLMNPPPEGRLTASIAILSGLTPTHLGAVRLKSLFEAAVYEAKVAGRNCKVERVVSELRPTGVPTEPAT